MGRNASVRMIRNGSNGKPWGPWGREGTSRQRWNGPEQTGRIRYGQRRDGPDWAGSEGVVLTGRHRVVGERTGRKGKARLGRVWTGKSRGVCSLVESPCFWGHVGGKTPSGSIPGTPIKTEVNRGQKEEDDIQPQA